MSQYTGKEQKSRNNNSNLIGSKTINESLQHQSLISQGALSQEKESSTMQRATKPKATTGQRKATSNLIGHYISQGGHNYTTQGQSSNLTQGLTITGASRAKMTQPGSSKPTNIAI